MLVSHKYKFVYIKTIKTAGTSTEIFLEPYCIENLNESHSRKMIKSDEGIVGTRMSQKEAEKSEFYNHMSPFEIKSKLGDSVFNDYKKIANIRNPFDILVSHYHFKPTYHLFTKDNLSFTDYILTTDVVESLSNKYRELLFLDENFIIDEVLRYENLQNDLENLINKLNLPKPKRILSKYKVSLERRGKPYQHFYTNEAIEIVDKHFKFYNELFGYCF
jgi:hypothetical protein